MSLRQREEIQELLRGLVPSPCARKLLTDDFPQQARRRIGNHRDPVRWPGNSIKSMTGGHRIRVQLLLHNTKSIRAAVVLVKTALGAGPQHRRATSVLNRPSSPEVGSLGEQT